MHSLLSILLLTLDLVCWKLVVLVPKLFLKVLGWRFLFVLIKWPQIPSSGNIGVCHNAWLWDFSWYRCLLLWAVFLNCKVVSHVLIHCFYFQLFHILLLLLYFPRFIGGSGVLADISKDCSFEMFSLTGFLFHTIGLQQYLGWFQISPITTCGLIWSILEHVLC